MKIQHIFDLAQHKFYHKYIHIKLPYHFQNFLFVLNENFHGRCTRQRHYIHTNRVNYSFAEKCIRYSVPRLINGINTNIYDKLCTHSFDGFVQFTKRFFIQNYTEDCTLVNCYVCQTNYVILQWSTFIYLKLLFVFMCVYVCMCICVCISLFLLFVKLIHSFSCALISEIILTTACLSIMSFIIFSSSVL